MNKQGKISKIQHFSLGDGPGIRTTVFMQGCNLRCPWCHNPETVFLRGSHLCYETKCSLCGLCGQICTQKAISFKNGERFVDKKMCSFCGACEGVCPQNAILISGKTVSQEIVFREIWKDIDFYKPSGGGVTFSGGEPLLQAEFVGALAKQCGENGIHTIVDTAGCVPYGSFEKVIPYTDMFFFDIKASNAAQFQKWCGRDFTLVLSNLKKLTSVASVTARMPVIPGYNDNAEYMTACGRLLSKCGVKRADLIPFHRMGSSKYRALGMEYLYENVKPPENTGMNFFREIIEKFGIECKMEQ